jgi:hypothetical protein
MFFGIAVYRGSLGIYCTYSGAGPLSGLAATRGEKTKCSTVFVGFKKLTANLMQIDS